MSTESEISPPLLEALRLRAFEAATPFSDQDFADAKSIAASFEPRDNARQEKALIAFVMMATGPYLDSPPTHDDMPEPETTLHNAKCVVDRVRAAGGQLTFFPASMFNMDWLYAMRDASLHPGVTIVMNNRGTTVTLRE